MRVMRYDIVKNFYIILESCSGHVGAYSKYVHTSMRQYIYTTISNRSIIDLTYISNNLYSLYVLIPLVLKDNGKIVVVGTSNDISRLANSILSGVSNNVYVLTTRWPSGFRTNFGRFSNIVKVYNKTSDLNKTPIIKDKYTRKYKEVENLGIEFNIPRIVIFRNTVDQDIAINEVNKLGIVSVGFVNSDSALGDKFTYTIPIGSSLDAMVTIILLLREIMDITSNNSSLSGVSNIKRTKGSLDNLSHDMYHSDEIDYPVINYYIDLSNGNATK